MDNLYQNNISYTDSDYSSSEEDPENINFNNIDYTNQFFLNNNSQKEYETTRNKLFTKDIIKQRILVDTHNIIKKTTNQNEIKTNNYVYYLNDTGKDSTTTENYNQTGGYDRYKNVIGFRFIKAIIPNRSYTINNTNNTFIIQLGSNAHIPADTYKQIKITLTNGYYTTNIFTEASDPENGAKYEWLNRHHDDPTELTPIEYTYYKLYIEYNINTKLFTFSMKKDVDDFYEFKFVWDHDNKYEGARNLLGFTGIDSDLSTSISGDQPPDTSVHYFDIVIPEIPYIACKHNTDRKNIIERIPVASLSNRLLVYEDTTFQREDQNFFFPISLNKLTIQLYQKNGLLFDNNNRHHSLEFEITMINKVDIMK